MNKSTYISTALCPILMNNTRLPPFLLIQSVPIIVQPPLCCHAPYTTTSSKRPYGYWKCRENIQAELLAFVAQQNNGNYMPTSAQLKSAGRSDLASAIRRYGPWQKTATELGLLMPRPHGYWTNRDNIFTELLEFVVSHKQEPIMPTQTELIEAGRADLAGAIRRYGSWQQVAKELGLVLSSIAKPRSLNLIYCTDLKSGQMKPYMYWRDFDNLRKELTEFIEGDEPGKLSEQMMMPTASELEAAGRSDLARAIKIHGGWEKVGNRMNMSIRSQMAKTWREFEVMQREVRKLCKDCDKIPAGCMPSAAVVREHGAAGLGVAIQKYHGGFANVARKMGLRMTVIRRPRGYWGKHENVKKEVLRVLHDLCRIDDERDGRVMPSHAEFSKLGKMDVYAAIERSGGIEHVAKELGLIYSGRGKSRKGKGVEQNG